MLHLILRKERWNIEKKSSLSGEPAAALDPIAEYNINRQIIDSSKKKSVVLISHRLTATRMADYIIMPENGAIIESGSHEELMQLEGKYAFMYKVQAEPYLKKSAPF